MLWLFLGVAILLYIITGSVIGALLFLLILTPEIILLYVIAVWIWAMFRK